MQVLTNLIANAVEVCTCRSPTQVRIYAETRNEWVRLWVEDNGIGIDLQDRERIFNVFERLHDADSYPGTGIGLAIVWKGVERMGGQVGIESQLGQGSRFWLELKPITLNRFMQALETLDLSGAAKLKNLS